MQPRPTASDVPPSGTRKKIAKLLVISASIFIIIVVALTGLSNRIVEYSLEKTLGEHFRVEHISLGLRGVEASGVSLLSKGEAIASARKITLRANPLLLFSKTYVISKVTIDEPDLTLEMGENGKLKLPFAQRETAADRARPRPLLIRHLVIRDGRFSFRDGAMKLLNGTRGEKLNIEVSNFSFPFKDSVSKVQLEGVFQGDLLAGAITVKGGVNLRTRGGDVECTGRNIVGLNVNGQGPWARTEAVTFKASSAGLPADPLVLSDVKVTAPFYRLETTKKGEVVNPLKTEKTSSRDNGKLRVFFKNITVKQGQILYVDRKIASPAHIMELTDIELTAGNFYAPFQSVQSIYDITAKIPGRNSTGMFKMTGKTNFKTKDTSARVSLQSLDMVMIRPYIEKKGDAEVARGEVNMNMDLTISRRTIYAPTRTTIRNLVFAPGKGIGGYFMGVPRAMVVKSLKTTNDEIKLDFTVEGDLDSPRFSFRESLTKRVTVSIARELGLSAVEVGETVVVQGARALKNIGKGLRNIFR